MDNSDNLIEKPKISTFLKTWQIIELAGIFLSIPLFFAAGILFTGDSPKVFNFVNSYILPSVGLFLIIKIIVAISFFKSKRWAMYFNLIQSLILNLVFLGLIIITFLAKGFPAIPIIFMFLFMLISWEHLKCLRHPFYLWVSKEDKK